MSCPLRVANCHRETEKLCPSRDAKGEKLCTLGETSMPVLAGEGYVEYKINFTGDSSGIVGFKLSRTHRAYIKMLAERGGEVPFNYGELTGEFREMIRRHLKDLIDMRIIKEVPIIGHDDMFHHHLTNLGANIATQIIKGTGAPSATFERIK